MIQERGDYKSFDPADILERLNTHEFQLAEKRDLYGPSYGTSHALKAKAVSESEGEDSGSSLGDLEELSQELAMLVKKFQKFSRRGRFGKSSRSDDSSSRDYKKRLCHKCKKPGHYIQDCPQWGKETMKKKYKDYSSDDSKKKNKSSKSSSSKSSKSSSHKKSSSKKARAFIGKEMDSEAESEEHEEEEASEESESGVASLALATTFVSKSIFNTEVNGFHNKADDDNDDYTPTYCFMAKGAKVLKYPSSESSEDESDENLQPSYSKLAKIAVKQQKAFEKVQNMLDKSDDMLGKEKWKFKKAGQLNKAQYKKERLLKKNIVKMTTDKLIATQTEIKNLSDEFDTYRAHWLGAKVRFVKLAKVFSSNVAPTHIEIPQDEASAQPTEEHASTADEN
ncbi:uncharacterized protein [Aegilops tauschii subsp. strangulata]|uniref:uncharacterized protein n=1 Tax=Aegilops tauschii subsp. strangulata TaxID=200361 RepID=UPI003CC8C268